MFPNILNSILFFLLFIPLFFLFAGLILASLYLRVCSLVGFFWGKGISSIIKQNVFLIWSGREEKEARIKRK